jgi:hypothetical protein
MIGGANHERVARAFRVLVAMFYRNELSLTASSAMKPSTKRKIRDCETPSPAGQSHLLFRREI